MPDLNDPAAKATLEQFTAKYEAERQRRLRADGPDQYRAVEGLYEAFDRDPNADPAFTRDPIVEDTDVAVIGAGISGLLTAVQLRKQGVSAFRVIDRAGDFGGTWYWSRYPGVACDVESYIYMPLLEETGYIPTEKYAKGPEIFAHCQRIASQFDLYPHAVFQTVVTELRWDEAISRWIVTTDRGDVIRARFAVTAGGILHKAKLPGIPGLETFAGKSFHTGRWDYDYTGGSPTEPVTRLADKRVALIGTGATGVQLVPRLAEASGHLYVVQRTPTNVGVRANRPTDPEWAQSLKPGWQKERIENFTRIVSGQPTGEDMVQDGFSRIFGANPNAMGLATDEEKLLDFQAMEEIRARIDAVVQDPDTAERLKPWYYQMCKRPCFHDEYLPAFNRANVTLVDTEGRGVERITAEGIVVDGRTIPVDCIIFASGYNNRGGFASRMGFEIYGRGGVSVTEAWADGPGTLHGMIARGFPNLLNIHMLQGGIAINFAHLLSELAVHAGWIAGHCLKNGITEVEPAAEAQEAWFHTLLGTLGTQPQFFAACTPAYQNNEGRMDMTPAAIRSIPYFGPTLDFLTILEDWRAEGALTGLEVRKG